MKINPQGRSVQCQYLFEIREYELQSKQNLKMEIQSNQSMEQESQMLQEENQAILYGLPTQRELLRQDGFVFGSKKSETKHEQKHLDDRKTEDVEEESEIAGSVEFRIAQSNVSGEVGNANDVFSNPDSSTNQKFILTIQGMSPEDLNQANPVSLRSKKKKIRKTRKTNAQKKKQKLEFGSETKNIPKNYGKQIIKFIKKEKKLTQRVLVSESSKYTYEKLILELKGKKKTLNKITDLKKLWNDYQFSKQVRILSSIFLRRYCFQWIFNSRIQKIKYPIKYRYKIIEGVQNPGHFDYLKDF